jgi:hypothetical protein
MRFTKNTQKDTSKVLRLPRQLERNSMCNQKMQEAIESTWAVETVLHEAHPGTAMST